MTRLDVRLASRYMRSRRSARLFSLITLIATAGVALGVTALIVVTGVMNGLQNELRSKILVASPHLRVLTFGRGLRIDDWRTVRDTVAKHPEVIAIAPFVLSQGLVSAGADYAEGVYVVGMEPDTGTMAVTALPRHFLEGDLEFTTTMDDVDGGMVLGRRLADRLNAYPGDRVTVVAPAGSKFNSALGTFVPKWWTFEVTGLFHTGMYEYDNGYVLVNRELAQRYAGLDDAVTGLEVRLRDPWSAPQVGREIEDQLGYPYRTLDWQSQNASLFSALKLEKLAMGTILLLIVVVAAFNIVSTLTMLVRDKTREIGILRAMGGLFLAYLVDQRRIIALDPSVYFIDHLPVHVQALDLLIIIAATVGVATLATLYPARQAATLDPVDAIRYE
jgi:lipoprotein-releasing system permease protein